MGKGHQLDPGTKRRSGGYKASSPSGPGATNPRGKNLEWKHASKKYDMLWKTFYQQQLQPRNTRASQPKRKGGRRK